MRAINSNKEAIITFSPDLRVDDPLAAFWMRQVTLRLRREVCWKHSQRDLLVDKAADSLTMHRFHEEKQAFFIKDPTAKYLTDQLGAAPPPPGDQDIQGSFSQVVRQLEPDDTAAFVLALGLAVVFDNAVGSVISLCLNDPLRTYPSLSLVQKLWDKPEQVLKLIDPTHPLFRFGLLRYAGGSSPSDSFIDWESPITVPALVANQLMFPGSPLPQPLIPVKPAHSQDSISTGKHRQVAAALHAQDKNSLRIVPVLGKRGAAHRDTVRELAAITDREVVECQYLPDLLDNGRCLNSIAALCWLKNVDLYLGQDMVSLLTGNQPRLETQLLSLRSIPITIYISITEKSMISGLPAFLLLPVVRVPGISFDERCTLWNNILGQDAKGLEPAIAECSRRFRYEKESIKQIAAGLKALPGKISQDDLTAACRAKLELDLGELAQQVTPRFKDEKLILPHKQHLQFREVAKAMKSLTRVHYQWGTADAWNESGISVLFAGDPGTGKTMAAEILALELDLPIFRIDLSQVVNKYIGETEKNLKRLFDAADVSDMILFFDEADSLFGRRTEVKDAHDRYANLEVSYLLERMERFKGLAILATNRKKNLDEAFLRRLRYIIDFPLPGIPQRKDIWRQVIPKKVDCPGVDFDFLAKQFPLAGGHIRSIVFNACLQAADGPAPAGDYRGTLTMEHIIAAVKREYDKLNRTVSLELFGPYAGTVKEMEQRGR
jgi:hypothetical protein